MTEKLKLDLSLVLPDVADGGKYAFVDMGGKMTG